MPKSCEKTTRWWLQTPTTQSVGAASAVEDWALFWCLGLLIGRSNYCAEVKRKKGES